MEHWEEEEEEDWLERELVRALERKDPSPDFAARVVARAAAPTPRVVQPAPRGRVFLLPRWVPAAAAVLVIAGSSGLAWRRHQQGMVAKEQVMLAMRITAGKLNRIQTHMREAQQ